MATHNGLLNSVEAAKYCGMSKRCLIKAVNNHRIYPDSIEKKNGKNGAYFFSIPTLDNFNAARKKRKSRNSTSNNNHKDTERNVSIMNNEEKTIVKDDTYNQDNDSLINEEANNNPEDSFVIDPEFEQLIAKLSDDEYSILKDSIAKEGIREPIIVWHNTIIDGHNRYRIAHELNIPIKYKTMDFKDREEAIEWIIINQLGRRNASKYERCRLALAIKPRIEAIAKANQGSRNDLTSRPKGQKVDTREEIAKIARVGHNLVDKVKFLEEHAPQELKEQLRNGEIAIDTVYKKLSPSKKTKRAKVTKQSADESTAQAKKFEPSTTIDKSPTDEVIDTSSEESSAINNSDTSPAEEELQQYENTDQNLAEESPVTADIKESFTDNEVTTTESTEQGIISHIKDCNNYINLLLLTSPYYSTEEALQKEWKDSIILLPPVELIDSFIEKLHNSNVSEALLIVPDDHCDKINDDIKGMSILWSLYLPFTNEWYNIFYFALEKNGNEDNTSSD